MGRSHFTLVLDDGSKLHYEPLQSRLTTENGELVDLAPVDGRYRCAGGFPPAIAVSPAAPGRKSRALKRIKIQMGLRCNYSCGYCSQASHRYLDRDKPVGEVLELVGKLRDTIIGHEADGADLRFEFWGGEPFVYWKIFKPLAEELRKAYPRATFTTVTNGSLLDDEKVDWLDSMGFGVGLSHDGPGYHVRGEDPLDDPAKLEVIRRLYHRLRPQGRLSFNCVLSMPNHSLAAILAFLCDKMQDDSVVLSTEGIISLYEPAVAMLMPQSEDDHRKVRRRLFADGKTDTVIYQVSTIHSALEEFFRSLERKRPAESLNQKCGMEREDSIAVDLEGNVLTCQNTSARTEHRIGHLDDMAGVSLTTATHWSHRHDCRNCPVVQLCKGACMYMEGEERRPTCDGHFTFNVAILALAVYSVTGRELVGIEGERVRKPGLTWFEF